MRSPSLLRTLAVAIAIAALLIPTTGTASAVTYAWTALASDPDGVVRALAFDSAGNLYVGGDFTTIGGTSGFNHVAKWSGTSWSAVGDGFDGDVYALTIDSAGTLYAGGYFLKSGSTTLNYIAKWNGTAWSGVGPAGVPGLNEVVKSLATDSSRNVYAGGGFTKDSSLSIDLGRFGMWNGTTWSKGPLASNAGFDGQVHSLATDGSGNVYAGGAFHSAGGVEIWNIAKLNSTSGTAWTALGSGSREASGTSNNVYALSRRGDDLYMGGNFTTANNVTANHIAKYNLATTTWTTFGTGFNGDVLALATDASGNVYAAGEFTTAGGLAVNHVAVWNGTTWSTMGSGSANSLKTLVLDSSGVPYAGGTFQDDNYLVSSHVAKWVPFNGYSVTYSGNGNAGGTAPTDSTSYNPGATVTVLGNTGTLTRTGYTFASWNTRAGGGGTTHAPNATFTINANPTLYAQWAVNTDTITYNGNGSTSGFQVDMSSPYNEGTTVTVMSRGNLAKTGYTFASWNTQAGGGGTTYAPNATFTLSVNTTLYAQWTLNSDTLTYNGNGATSGSRADTNSPYSDGATVTVKDQGTFARTGYTFASWNTQAGGGGTSYAPNATFTINAITTLYAQWVSSGGGSSTSGGGPSPSPVAATPTPTPSPTVAEDPLDPIPGGTTSAIPAGGMTAGRAALLVNGLEVPVTVQPNSQAHPVALLLSASTLVPPLAMRLEGRGGESEQLGLTTGQALILQSDATERSARATDRVRAQPVAESSGTGFKENTPAKFYLLPNTYLGSLATDTSGSYRGSVPVPAGLAPGVYTLQVNALAPDDSVRSISIGVLVKPAQVATRTKLIKITVHFDGLSSALTQRDKARLGGLAKRIGKRALTIRCIGYVQPTTGTQNDNMLSTARANAAARYLKFLGVIGTYVVRGAGSGGSDGPEARRAEITFRTIQ